MPLYDLTCGHMKFLTFSEFDRVKREKPSDTCPSGCVDSRPVSANLPVFYGAWRISDKTFRDAEEATGEKISSTKDIDRLEKAGVFTPVTNPSTYHFKNGKKLGKLDV